MYQDSAAATKRIAEFLGMEVTPEVIQKVVANSSIDEMRAKASIGLNHLRKGGYGGWRTSFTVAMSEFFDDVSIHTPNTSVIMFSDPLSISIYLSLFLTYFLSVLLQIYQYRMEGSGLKFNFGPNSRGVDVIM